MASIGNKVWVIAQPRSVERCNLAFYRRPSFRHFLPFVNGTGISGYRAGDEARG
jgi:hypothetical protein